MLTFTFKKLPRWNRWVRQFSYILKSGIGMRVWQQAYGSATAYATFKDVAFTDDSGLQMQEHLFLIVYFLTQQLQLLN
jgi:hypothetical protein